MVTLLFTVPSLSISLDYEKKVKKDSIFLSVLKGHYLKGKERSHCLETNLTLERAMVVEGR